MNGTIRDREGSESSMPLFGSHLSVAGGMFKAVQAAEDYGFDCVQIFTKAPSQWSAKPIEAEEAKQFRQARRRSGIAPVVVHDSYLINLASSDDVLWRRSIEAFIDELQRADTIGADFLVTHPGAHLGAGEEAGINRVIAALNEIHGRIDKFTVRVLLETTAGQGTSLGHRFEHLAAILDGVRHPRRLGICFDTCHVFAAGYALAPEAAYHATLAEFERLIGIDRIQAFHVNDSKKDRGSRVDRHAHIGHGFLGEEPFQLLVNDPRFTHRPMILETPKETLPEFGDMDTYNLSRLRGYCSTDSDD